MSLEKFTNNAIATLGSSVAPTSTTITLSAGSGALFPALTAGQYFTGTMFAAGSSTGTPNEIVKVTGRIGDTLTVVRGQEGTSASSWGVGDTFANFPTAAFLSSIVLSGDIQSQPGNSAVDTGAANQGIIVLNPAITSLSQILFAPIRVYKVSAANNASYSLIVNGLSPQLVTLNGQPLASGQLVGNQVFEVVWDGTNFDLMSNPSQIQNNQLANMPAQTVKANTSLSGAAPSDVSISSLAGLIGIGTGLLSTNGYFQVPIIIGGVSKTAIVQWGKTANINSESSVSVTFPIAFPNACLNAGATIVIPSASNFYDQGAQIVGTPGTTGMTVFLQQYDGSGHNYPVSISWFVIGY